MSKMRCVQVSRPNGAWSYDRMLSGKARFRAVLTTGN